MNRPTLTLALCLFSAQAAAFGLGDLNVGDLTRAVETVKNVKKATTDIDEPQEIELGSGIASNLLGAAPLMKDAAVQQYVNKVGKWLALHSERPGLPWQFGVLDDMDVNAFAAPGGYIFITRGLMAQLHSESELAGVIAHEMSHVLRKHYLQAIKKGAQTDLLAAFGQQALENQGVNPALTKLVDAGTEVYARGLDKADEFECDRMAVVIAARAGYEPYGLPAVLQTLQGMNPKDSSLALLFKTHPSASDRLEKLDRLMPGKFDRYENQPDQAERFRAAMKKSGI